LDVGCAELAEHRHLEGSVAMPIHLPRFAKPGHESRLPQALCLAASAALMACASVPEPPGLTWQQKLAATGWTVGAEVDTLPNFSFDGFEALDAQHVVIHTSVTRRALITAGPGCIGMTSALKIGYKNIGSHSLERLDTLLVHAPGDLPSRCVVDEIHLLQPPAKT
jgi:hypothetical protein